jgi:PGF-CTERM protein
MVAVLVVSALAGPAGAIAAAQSTADETPGVTFDDGTAGGSTVVVDEVTVPDGGFVTIHDDTLTDGDVLGSVVGTSAYLEAGTHENVTVSLDSTVESGTFHAMAHRDTDGDRTYTFVSSNGEADGPYTVDGDIAMDDANVTVAATVTASDQPTEGSAVIVDRVELSEGGFVTVHDSSLADGAVFDSIRGTSDYLEAGVHEDVRVELDDELESDDRLFAMAHRDTNDNEAYDFPATEGDEDGPFVGGNEDIVMAPFDAELDDEAAAAFAAQASGGNVVVVDEVYLPDGGFVTMHDSSLADGAVFDSIRGTSDYLEPGIHRDVVVRLDEPLSEDDTLFAMAHQDTNDNEAYDFPASEGDDDGPYATDGGDLVMDDGNVTVSAGVAFEGQPSDGTTVTVERVDLSEGGFVTVHDASLAGGATFDSVRGTSEYLEAGVHEDVQIELDKPLRETNRLLAMPHADSDGDETYDFVETSGGADGPFLDGNDRIVMAGATASVTAHVAAADQETDSETVVVDEVTLHDGGFVTVHDSSLADGAVFDSIRGTSDYLAPGTHEDVEIRLDEPLSEDGSVYAMAHRDTNGNEAYDFPATEGGEDGPYVAAGAPVMSLADATVTADNDDGMDGNDSMDGDDEMDGNDSMDGDDEMNGDDGTSNDATTNDDTPGFGAVVALVALLATALLAHRRG